MKKELDSYPETVPSGIVRCAVNMINVKIDESIEHQGVVLPIGYDESKGDYTIYTDTSSPEQSISEDELLIGFRFTEKVSEEELKEEIMEVFVDSMW